MRRLLLLLLICGALVAVPSAAASTTVRLALIHALHGCHVWGTADSRPLGASWTTTLKRGTKIEVRVSCPMDFDVVQISGPGLAGVTCALADGHRTHARVREARPLPHPRHERRVLHRPGPADARAGQHAGADRSRPLTSSTCGAEAGRAPCRRPCARRGARCRPGRARPRERRRRRHGSRRRVRSRRARACRSRVPDGQVVEQDDGELGVELHRRGQAPPKNRRGFVTVICVISSSAMPASRRAGRTAFQTSR